MAIDYTTPQSPGWWLARLLKQLADRQERLELLDSYYRGDPPMPFVPSQHRSAFARVLRMSRSNFAQLVVDAVNDRMEVVGFRSGATGTAKTDQQAWDIWQGNDLDADSSLITRASLTMGDSYAIVGPPLPDEPGIPVITPEDPRQVVTVQEPIRKRRSLAGLKLYCDEVTCQDTAFLYLPGVVYQFEKDPKLAETERGDLAGWLPIAVNPTGIKSVPVVRFANRMDLLGKTLGEFENVVDILDRITNTILERMVIARFQSFRQRVVMGLDDVDKDGNKIDYSRILTADPGSMAALNEGTSFWESGVTDMTPIISAAKADVMDLAAATRTPLFYLTPDAANGSAEGASLAREGLVFKTEDRQRAAGESYETMMSIAYEFLGATARADTEVMWRPAERFTLAERYDAAVKGKSIGIPLESLLSDVLERSPQEVERTMAQVAAETAKMTTQSLVAEAEKLGNVQVRIADPLAAPASATGAMPAKPAPVPA